MYLFDFDLLLRLYVCFLDFFVEEEDELDQDDDEDEEDEELEEEVDESKEEVDDELDDKEQELDVNDSKSLLLKSQNSLKWHGIELLFSFFTNSFESCIICFLFLFDKIGLLVLKLDRDEDIDADELDKFNDWSEFILFIFWISSFAGRINAEKSELDEDKEEFEELAES